MSDYSVPKLFFEHVLGTKSFYDDSIFFHDVTTVYLVYREWSQTEKASSQLC